MYVYAKNYKLRLELLKAQGSEVKTWDDLKRLCEKKYGQNINYSLFCRAVTNKLTTERGDELRRMADDILSELEGKEVGQ